MSSEFLAPTLQPVVQSAHCTQPCCRMPCRLAWAVKLTASSTGYAVTPSQRPRDFRVAATPRCERSLIG